MKPNKMLLLACRGDKALARHLKGLGYSVSRSTSRFMIYGRHHDMVKHCLEKDKANILSSYQDSRYAVNPGCLAEQSLFSIVSDLVSLPPEECPLLLVVGNRGTFPSMVTRRGMCLAKGIGELLQDLLEYKTR